MELKNSIKYGGFCPGCGQEHCLGVGQALVLARRLFYDLQVFNRLDFEQPGNCWADSGLDLSCLWGPARGQMFGVLHYIDKKGRQGVLKAFSGQFNGRWMVPGWVPPVFDIADFELMVNPVEKKIKKLGAEIELCRNMEGRQKLIKLRKAISRELMLKIHSLYKLDNFRGETVLMADIFNAVQKKSHMPTGTGDCCAPKLLNYAAVHGLIPLGMVEFYFGKENKSKTRQHGSIYPSCLEKCWPILGFLLCGLINLKNQLLIYKG